jgi:hypothetical protein
MLSFKQLSKNASQFSLNPFKGKRKLSKASPLGFNKRKPKRYKMSIKLKKLSIKLVVVV